MTYHQYCVGIDALAHACVHLAKQWGPTLLPAEAQANVDTRVLMIKLRSQLLEEMEEAFQLSRIVI